MEKRISLQRERERERERESRGNKQDAGASRLRQPNRSGRHGLKCLSAGRKAKKEKGKAEKKKNSRGTDPRSPEKRKNGNAVDPEAVSDSLN